MTLTNKPACYNEVYQSELSGFFKMLVNIRTREKCGICGARFKLSYRGFSCPNHPQSKPRRVFLDWFYHGQRFVIFSFDSFDAALNKAGAITTEIETFNFKPENYLPHKGRAGQHRYSFTNCFEIWLQRREKDKNKNIISPAYYKKLEKIKPLFCDFFLNEDVRLLREHRINDFLDSLPDKLSPKTQLNYLSILRAFLKHLKQKDKILNSVPDFPDIKPQTPTIKWLTAEEQEKVMSFIPDQHRNIFDFLNATGCRPQEARALLWSDIDLKAGIMTVRHSFSGAEHRKITKTKHERILPLTPAIVEMLKGIKNRVAAFDRKGYVFLFQGKPYTHGRIYKTLKSAAKKAAVDVSLYGATRHSFASNALNRGVSKGLIGEFLGHKDPKTTEKYAHVNMEGLRQVITVNKP